MVISGKKDLLRTIKNQEYGKNGMRRVLKYPRVTIPMVIEMASG